MRMDKWVIFDAMGVIFVVGDDTNELLVPYIQKRNPDITREYINEIYLDVSLGKITSDDFWGKMNLGGIGYNREICKDYLDNYLIIDSEFINIAKKLKEKYHLAILSNDVSEWSKYLRKKFGLDELVDFSIISGDCGLRKPDERIYELAIKKAGGAANNCVFIDDREKNLLPAIKVGMNVIKYEREYISTTTIEDVMSIKSFNQLKEKLDLLWDD